MGKIRRVEYVRQEVEYEMDIDQAYVDSLMKWLRDYFKRCKIDKEIPNLTVKEVCLIFDQDEEALADWMFEQLTGITNGGCEFITSVYDKVYECITDDIYDCDYQIIDASIDDHCDSVVYWEE